MTRVRFIAPSSGGLQVIGARAALANALFARANKGHFAIRLPPGEDRITADLRWLGINWDTVGEPGDYAAAIDQRAGADEECRLQRRRLEGSGVAA